MKKTVVSLFPLFSLWLVACIALAAPLATSTALVPAGPSPASTHLPPQRLLTSRGANAPARVQAEQIAIRHHSGQSFITWSERADLSGERYRIYRHNAPITAANLAQATRLYEVSKGSARFYANRYNVEGSGTWQGRYVDRFVIEDRAGPLPADTGLLVWTLAITDFNGLASGAGYYAVAVVPAGSVEVLAAGYSAGPVSEAVGDPLPVEVAADVGRGGHVYLQYMDLRRWNPTFHAPNAANVYYGLDPADPLWAEAIQYAYDYVVYEPRPEACGGRLPAAVPVFFNLHGWGDNTYAPPSDYPDSGYCAYGIYPVDVSQTWWFGFARRHDYRTEGEPEAGDMVVNYTEQRLLRMVYDLIRQPPAGPVDQQRIYVYGQSMGGSGTLALALRYPDVFAAAYASEPMTNYRTAGDGGGVDWRGDVTPKWGSPALNLPVQIEAPNGWAVPLLVYNGTGVWDWQDHQANLVSRLGEAMTPLGVAHGRLDTTIEWTTQGQPAYAAFNAARRAWGGAVMDADHTWLDFNGLPPTLAPLDYAPFYKFQVLRDETVPGLSNASGDLPLPPQAPGGYNQTLHWSSSWDAWDGAPLDTPDKWQISLCAVANELYDANPCGSGPAQTVDVTPRRVQRFILLPGLAYIWENRRVSDNGLVASGVITASAAGLLTVPSFAVSSQGNRLLLQPVDGPLPTETSTPTRTPTSSAATPTPTNTPPSGDFGLFLPWLRKGPASVSTLTPTPTATVEPGAPRPWPDTTAGIHIFNDQLAGSMSPAQRRFAATHYAGTQKMTRSEADLLRAINPNFLILHYRLGLGLGYRAIQSNCRPAGDWLQVIEGDHWVQEWPGEAVVQETWLYHWPEDSSTRLLNCDWGWYVGELDHTGWRAYWSAEVLRQVQANQDDGVFMDSLSVLNYLGNDHYAPGLPAEDAAFEAAWARRIQNWLTWLQSQALGRYWIVPNVGAWNNGRDTTDYSPADGVMVEGFAMQADASPYPLDDWRLQINRALGLIAQNKAVLLQTYVVGNQERMFSLGSYLLVKGSRTYFNLELDLAPEWWPEYDLPIGVPSQSAGTDIENLYESARQVYRRDFSNGLVLVNPTSPYDGSARTVMYDLGATYYLAHGSGGGELPENGIPTGILTYQAVTQLTLPPATAAVLLSAPP